MNHLLHACVVHNGAGLYGFTPINYTWILFGFNICYMVSVARPKKQLQCTKLVCLVQHRVCILMITLMFTACTHTYMYNPLCTVWFAANSRGFPNWSVHHCCSTHYCARCSWYQGSDWGLGECDLEKEGLWNCRRRKRVGEERKHRGREIWHGSKRRVKGRGGGGGGGGEGG